MLNIYARYGALYLIKCQDCKKEFHIGEAFSPYNDVLYAVPAEYLHPGTNLAPDGKFWVRVDQCYFLDLKSSETKRLTLKETVESFHYGDPPSHGCVGDTMGAIEIKTLEVWDMNFGRTVDPQTNRITNWGTPERIPELENIDLRDEWAIEAGF